MKVGSCAFQTNLLQTSSTSVVLPSGKHERMSFPT